jgi:hypothetical protein
MVSNVRHGLPDRPCGFEREENGIHVVISFFLWTSGIIVQTFLRLSTEKKKLFMAFGDPAFG